MAAKSSNVEKWSRLLEEMKRCKSAAELVQAHGQPAHKLPQAQFEIWHYPLGVDQGVLYTIHGAVMGDQLKQLYLHMEPTADAIPPAKPPWWKRLFAARKTKTGDPMRALLDDPDLYDRITAATPQQRRRAAVAVARFAVERIAFNHPVVDKALSHLASGSPSDPRVAAAVQELADQLDQQYDELEANAQSKKAAAPFAQARAACSVGAALTGDAADAAYEAINATEDRARVRDLMLAALSGNEEA